MYRAHKEIWYDVLWMTIAVMVFVAVLLFPALHAHGEALSQEEETLLHAWKNGELIRLHIVANSDSPDDQAVKLAVRDAVIAEFGQMLQNASCNGSDALYDLLISRRANMQLIAQQTARANGYHGSVAADVGWLELPAKTYGRVTLPAGSYRALRITLGSGSGQNWWCVLYPQLCLALAAEDAGSAVTWHAQRIWELWVPFAPPD